MTISPCALFGGLLSPYCVSGEWYTQSPRTVLTDFFISLVGSGRYRQRERKLRRIQARAKAAFKIVFANGSKIDLEHHLLYHARKCSSFTLCLACPYLFRHLSDYELDRSLSPEDDDTAARVQFNLVLSGKATTHGRKGKYSIEMGLPLVRYFAQEC
jgi:hypothetical protein